MTLGNELPDGVQVTMVRKGGQNIVPAGESTLLSAGDGLLIVADREGCDR